MTASGMTYKDIRSATGMYFDRSSMLALRDRRRHHIWSQGHLINFAAALGIRTSYFVDDELFVAAATPARKAASRST